MGADFQALAALRTFAKKKIPVILVDSVHKIWSVSTYSKYKKKIFKSPSPSEENSYLDFLISLCKSEGIRDWIIIPNSDETVYILSKYKTELKKYYKLTVPDWDVIKKVYIKKNTYQIAEQYNIPIPKTWYPKDLEELGSLDLEYPLIIKPSIRDHFFNTVKTKAYRVNNKNELFGIYKYVCQVIDPSEVLIQEMIEGGPENLYSYGTFYKKDFARIGAVARRSRQHPMDFGHATTFAEIVNIPEITDLANKFLESIDYYGIAEVEFMFDRRHNKYKLIEVNPRIWGWHSLLIAAGLDLPYYLYLDTIGEKFDYQMIDNSIKWVRLITDLPTVFQEVIKGRIKMSNYLKTMLGKKEYAVWSHIDPLPFLMELALIPYLWYKRGF